VFRTTYSYACAISEVTFLEIRFESPSEGINSTSSGIGRVISDKFAFGRVTKSNPNWFSREMGAV
jgi:hypothetical protein